MACGFFCVVHVLLLDPPTFLLPIILSLTFSSNFLPSYWPASQLFIKQWVKFILTLYKRTNFTGLNISRSWEYLWIFGHGEWKCMLAKKIKWRSSEYDEEIGQIYTLYVLNIRWLNNTMFYHNFKSENGQWLRTGNTQSSLNLKGKWKAQMWLWASSHRSSLATVKGSVNA